MAPPVLDAPVRFGAAPVFAPQEQFLKYERLTQEISWKIGALNKATLSIIRYDPDFAAVMGASILESFQDINERINGLQTGTMDECLMETLSIMRELERIVQRFDRTN